MVKIILNYILRASEYNLVKIQRDYFQQKYFENMERIDELEHERDYLDGKCAELEKRNAILELQIAEMETSHD